MTDEQLNERVERLRKENEAATKRVKRRSRELERAAERSVVIVDRAMRRIRQGFVR